VPRNVLILSLCQALGLAGAPSVVLVGGLVGETIAPTPGLATLPIAALVLGTAATSVPAALLMRRVGRRRGFIAGAFVGMAASLVGTLAISADAFFGLCAATFLVGGATAFVLQYRFAAIESVEPQRAGHAVSFVLLGGIAAGFIGPESARLARGWLSHEFAGSFLALALLYALVAATMLALRDVSSGTHDHRRATGRPVHVIISQPDVIVAIGAGMTAYAVMSFIMTATPISMHTIDGHSVDATARVIQSHAIAMYLPSLFAGTLIARLGPRGAVLIGLMVLASCVAVSAGSHALLAYWLALVLLGIGWNFLFVGGTVLLTQGYSPAERFRTQATNDFLIFGTQAAASLSAGAALQALGWRALNIATLPALVAMLLLTLFVRGRNRSGPQRVLQE